MVFRDVAKDGTTRLTGGLLTEGEPGRGIASTTTRYQVGTSATVAPTGTWQTTPQATATGQYLWTRTVLNYTDGSSSTSYSVAAHGATGAQGVKGDKGNTGDTGPAGVGIASSTTDYQVGSSPTAAPTGTWTSSPSATSPGQYLWTRLRLVLTDASTKTAYSVAAHGATGAQGVQGIQGSRWGTTGNWLYGGVTNVPVAFPDGGPPRVGDWIVSTNALGLGDLATVVAVVDATHADLHFETNIRGPKGDKGDPGDTNPLAAYPVGAIYMSVVNTSPATLFGGTWAVWGTGRVPVAVDTSQTEFNTVQKTGGEKAHVLTEAETALVGHDHAYGVRTFTNTGTGSAAVAHTRGDGVAAGSAQANGEYTYWNSTSRGGYSAPQAHNNLQPYITCYMWRRTA